MGKACQRKIFFKALWALAAVGAAPARSKGVCVIMGGVRGPSLVQPGFWRQMDRDESQT